MSPKKRPRRGWIPTRNQKYSVRFAVIGLDHNHINGMTAAVQRGGGELVAVYATSPEAIAGFRKRFGDVKVARSEDEILNDPSIQLVAGAPIPDQRAPLGIRVMRHGKDYLSDKPGIVTLQQLAEVRKAIRRPGESSPSCFQKGSEVRAAVKAGELVKAGAIGRVIQTVNLAPHKVNDVVRPDWFWDTARYGGILCDVDLTKRIALLLHGDRRGGCERVANRECKSPGTSQNFRILAT